MGNYCITIELKPYKGCRIEKDIVVSEPVTYVWYDSFGRIHLAENGEGFKTIARTREDISQYLGR